MPKQVEVLLYQEDEWNSEKIKDIVQKRSSVKEFIIAFHDKDTEDDGTQVKPHFHVYLNFGNTNWPYEAVAKWFGVRNERVSRIKAELRGKKSGKYAVARYYTHQDYPNKHYYSPSTFVASFDVEEYLNAYEEKHEASESCAARKHRDAEILNLCALGEITQYNYHEKITAVEYARNEKKILSIWKYLIDKKLDESKGTRNCKTIWICGESGVGKTTLAGLFAKRLNMPKYITNPGNDPLGGYRQEPIIVVDELRPDEGFNYKSLLQFLDPYNRSGTHSRYHDKYPTVDYIFVCSVYSPEEYYASSVVDRAKNIDTKTQLFRRIAQVWNVSKERIDISEYAPELKDFIVCDSVENPVPGYVEEQRAEGTHSEDPLDTLKAISKNYCRDTAQLSLFDDDFICGNTDAAPSPAISLT